MSLIFTDVEEAGVWAATKCADGGMERLRIIGQCVGLQSEAHDAAKLQLVLRNLRELSCNNYLGELKVAVGETCYEKCIGGKRLLEGSICDMMCCTLNGVIEVMDLKVWSLTDLKAFRLFWHSEAGTMWREVSAGYTS
ncbi:LADA_0D10858g1_1 [Lachancea dasiensis]|uniref:LADA_0D10858g1_1 n=1 Tax=Lachancea dasiensis TaxID=1072105 RepID=A0A1G4J7R2_9SACH|nr:LADA_0D10858g1_1 [Lachancea dasiensis]